MPYLRTSDQTALRASSCPTSIMVRSWSFALARRLRFECRHDILLILWVFGMGPPRNTSVASTATLPFTVLVKNMNGCHRKIEVRSQHFTCLGRLLPSPMANMNSLRYAY